MKKIAYVSAVSSLSTAILLAPSIASAANFAFQPRLEAGFLYYDFESQAGAFSSSPLGSGGSILTQQNSAQGDFRWKDTLPLIGGGLTFFVDRFFADFSIQYAFNGSASDSQTNSAFTEGGVGEFSTFSSLERSDDVDFDRTEYAISFGYSITDNWVVFAGYKKAETNFESDFSAITRTDTVPILDLNENVTIATIDGELDYDVEQDGPFIGSSYGWRINKGAFDGVFAASLALAFLDSEIKQKLKNQQATFIFPEEIGPLPVANQTVPTLKGDTVGLTLGFTWRGFTPVEGLTYSLGIQGYNYDFDSDETLGEFTETAITFKAGVAYTF
ncbi:MAG: hypothetical protein V2J55_20325 [Candidatus Competibacteraceae bacterium]|nr:hypothetical protein [Candidatus Competibacteraceae bacterium]